jgi:hypothetical protein
MLSLCDQTSKLVIHIVVQCCYHSSAPLADLLVGRCYILKSAVGLEEQCSQYYLFRLVMSSWLRSRSSRVSLAVVVRGL